MKINKYFVAILLLFAFCLNAEETLPVDRDLKTLVEKLEAGRAVKIACLGDSITGVYFHTGSRMAWPELLEQGLRYLYPKAKTEVINAGVSGDTSQQALKRLEKDVLAKKPDFTVIMLGMNDHRIKEQESLDAMEEIIKKNREAGIPVMGVSQNFTGSANLPAYIDSRKALFEKMSVPYADCYLEFKKAADARVKGPEEKLYCQFLNSDGVHPSLDGHRLFVRTIIKRMTGKDIPEAALGGSVPKVPLLIAKGTGGKIVTVTVLGMDSTLALKCLKRAYPSASFSVLPRSVPSLDWFEVLKEIDTKKDRDLKKARELWGEKGDDLLLVCFPPQAKTQDSGYFSNINSTRRVIFNFGKKDGAREVVWISDSVLNASAPDRGALKRDGLMARFAGGMDVGFIGRKDGDTRPPEELIAEWFDSQKLTK